MNQCIAQLEEGHDIENMPHGPLRTALARMKSRNSYRYEQIEENLNPELRKALGL